MGSAVAQQVRKAKVFGNSNNCLDGRYTYLIERIIENTTRQGIAQVIAELRVVESSPVEVAADLRRPSEVGAIPYSKPGERVSFKVQFKNDSAGGNVAAFAYAIEGTSAADFDGPADSSGNPTDLFTPYWEQAISPAQPFRGFLINDSTYRTLIKSGANKGQPFTGHNWKFHPGNSKDEVAQRRAALDAEEKAAAK